MNASRALAVLAAATLVAAFALATLLQPTLTLAGLVVMDDAHILFAAREFVLAHLPAWVWTDVAMPVLQRPCWLLPASAGIIFAGGSMSLAFRNGVPRSHRKRS